MQSRTSWQNVSNKYHKSVGEKGSYFHTHTVIPNLIRLLNLSSDSKLLDLGCGQGVLSRHIAASCKYTGIDSSPSLIKTAISLSHTKNHQFIVADATKPLPLPDSDFTHCTIVLALQNMSDPKAVFTNAYKHLSPGGRLVLVLNHPCFRIPRQSSWEIDPQNKLQYRRINRYMSELKIPITMDYSSPQSNAPVTWSFHFPLSSYFKYLNETGFLIETLEEWTSDKESVGKHSKGENLARSEFPLFLALSAVRR